jgi:hypothetical protein
LNRNPYKWRTPKNVAPKRIDNRPALRERFHKVILLSGYTEEAAQRILAEHFDQYMLDVPAFEAMMKNYEDNQGDPE